MKHWSAPQSMSSVSLPEMCERSSILSLASLSSDLTTYHLVHSWSSKWRVGRENLVENKVCQSSHWPLAWRWRRWSLLSFLLADLAEWKHLQWDQAHSNKHTHTWTSCKFTDSVTSKRSWWNKEMSHLESYYWSTLWRYFRGDTASPYFYVKNILPYAVVTL